MKDTLIKYFVFIWIIYSISSGEQYNIPLASLEQVKINQFHLQYPNTNSAIYINGRELDIFQWQVAAINRKSVKLDILNPTWEFAAKLFGNINIPNEIEISTSLNFRGTPIVLVKLIPWRIKNNNLEVLTDGEVHIKVDPIDFPITFKHPSLLNYTDNNLQKQIATSTEYLIICPSKFIIPAQQLADMYNLLVDSDFRLNTQVVITDSISTDISGLKIRNYILNHINSDLKFLLLLGDENDLPPILHNDLNSNFPSDDFYSTPQLYMGNPQLITGRIPVSTLEEASSVINKISEYTMTPTPGIWRSKIALIADDMFRSCSYNEYETSHTTYSQELYESLKTILPIQSYYGLHYNLQHTNSGCSYPELTQNIIQSINNGIGLVNYIGHGNSQTWSDEYILNKSRDLSLIHPANNKLAIWVAGTCSFGNYYGENSFMEDLLVKKDGAIAIIATTDAIGYTPNWNYIRSLYGLNNDNGLMGYINNYNQLRLGELVWHAKNMNNDYKFHTFGDPALILPFPVKANSLIIDPPDTLYLVEEQSISFNDLQSNSSIIISEKEKEFIFYSGTDSIQYSIPGNTYAQFEMSKSNCYRIPLDAGVCINCVKMQIYQESMNVWNNKIETINNISIIESLESFDDYYGPEILLFQNKIRLNEGSVLLPNMDLTISLQDESGINLMETIGHGIRYSINYNDLIQLPGNEFIFSDCSNGHIIIPFNFPLHNESFNFYVEAWDGLNNKSEFNINLNLNSQISQNKLELSYVFPIPNPFSNNTDFTMISSHFPINININVFSINGHKIISINKSINDCNESFSNDNGCLIKINWNGKDINGDKIANGTYFYQIKATTINNLTYENIYKIAKIE